MALSFTVNAKDQHRLGELARGVIAAAFSPSGEGFPPLPSDASALLRAPLGAFVTLHLQGRLRGCIGNMISEAPLWDTVARMARAAAFTDPRFPPLSPGEWPEVELEISVLGPLSLCPDPDKIEIGRHGLLLTRQGRSGVFLPQVPVEQGWDLPRYLEQLCGKANLPPGSWKGGDARLFWFESVVFSVPGESS